MEDPSFHISCMVVSLFIDGPKQGGENVRAGYDMQVRKLRMHYACLKLESLCNKETKMKIVSKLCPYPLNKASNGNIICESSGARNPPPFDEAQWGIKRRSQS